MMTKFDYDVLVIGAGPGGSTAATGDGGELAGEQGDERGAGHGSEAMGDR